MKAYPTCRACFTEVRCAELGRCLEATSVLKSSEPRAMQGVDAVATGSDGSIEAAFLAGFEAGERSEQFRTEHRSGMSLHTAEEALALWKNGARQNQ